EVAGYVVAGKDDAPGNLQAGAWRIPTKQPGARNETFAGKDWFDSATNPDITFVLVKAEANQGSPPPGGTATKVFGGKLHGELTIHGVTRSVVIPASMTFVDESATTATFGKGNLISLRSKFDIKLADFNISGPADKKPGEIVHIDQEFVFATVA